ncbi:MAG TPA: hypothetical protein VN736_16225 [Candidatus Limnocylindrales bacterium]|jgi:Spy/CpxP family protein refolding chaperone|nr:hypothetical protein [Candidatus Limnocylindrales bacterium]
MNTNLLEKPAAGRAWDPRTACALALVLVFLCGCAVGALVMDLGVHKARPRVVAFDSPAGKRAYFERLQKELNLTPAQSDQMESILNDFWQYYVSVLSESKTKVEQILTPDQRTKFEKILQEEQPK